MKIVYPYVSVNLELTKRDELGFPFLDYGFLYGYGLFESIRVAKGIPVLLDDHVSRMKRGSIILDIPFEHDVAVIEQSVLALIKKNDVQDAHLNFYLTPGDRSQDPAEKIETNSPLLLMVLRPWPDYDYDARVHLSVRQVSFQRTPIDRLKTLSWMKNVLERKFSSHTDDVLMYDENGCVLESSRANVFFVKDDVVITPKSNVILQGITRQYLLNNQDEFGYKIRLESVYLEALDTFDEIFLTNSLKGVILVDKVENFDNLQSKSVSKSIQNQYLNSLSLR